MNDSNNIIQIENPYRPLVSLGKSDQDILIGRENDLRKFINALQDSRIKVLILDGYAGVGKSSFLRSGLLQKIKSLSNFDIIEFANGENIVSCGIDPIANIANAIFNSQWKDDILKSEKIANNHRIEKLRKKIVDDFESEEKLTNSLKEEKGITNFFSLCALCSYGRKILIIDHVEQIFTSPDSNFIEFFSRGIRYFSTRDCNAIIILSIRADFLGPLREKIYNRLLAENIIDIYLDDIEDERYLIEAIKKPCDKIGYSFSNDEIPMSLLREIRKKKISKSSILPIIHIIFYKIFENAMKRIRETYCNDKIITSEDAYDLNNKEYVQIIILFVQDRVRKICASKYPFKISEEQIYNLLYFLTEDYSNRKRIIEREEFIEKIKTLYEFDDKKTATIINMLNEERIIIADSRVTLSHDLFAEAVCRLKTGGLVNVFEDKRDPSIEDAMESILSEFEKEFKKNLLEKLRIASVVGKQFFHKNENNKLYKQMNKLLETINNTDTINSPIIKVLISKPFSKLFLYRAESETGINLNNFHQGDDFHSEVWEWKENKIFYDSAITIARLFSLVKLYKNVIDVRLSDFMPVSMLTYRNQSISNSYTFAAHEKKNEKEEWRGALPTYHHVLKEAQKKEFEDHFDYLWNKSANLKEFLQELTNDDKNNYKEYKGKFLDHLKKEGLDYELI